MQAIIKACKSGELSMTPRVVISNNANSNTLKIARSENIPAYCFSSKTHPNPEQLDKTIRDTMIKHEIQLVVLAGYIKKIANKTLSCFRNKIINIHPALLPKYGGKGMYGLKVHQAVIKNKEKETGITIHLVDEKYDHGPTLNVIKIPISPEDNAESLQKKVHTKEHRFYVDTLVKISQGDISLNSQPL